MPKQTFYKLPQEKQERILAAAKREFTQVRYSDASINQIIRDAGIPRGSFYQYFDDKVDLVAVLVKTFADLSVEGGRKALQYSNGDIFYTY